MRDFAERAILGCARIGEGDIEGLAALVTLHDVVEQAVGVACRELVKPVEPAPAGNGKPATRPPVTRVPGGAGPDSPAAGDGYAAEPCTPVSVPTHPTI